MTTDEPSSIQTRPSLLNRLKAGDDVESWREFYRVYGKLVRDFAIHAGLTDAEADEVVQETAIGVARKLPEFEFDPARCSFKTWLLNQARWRVIDQFRKRRPGKGGANGIPTPEGRRPALSPDDTARTATVERVPDPAALNLDALFEVEWRKTLLMAALERVKTKFTLRQIQVFDLTALQEWPASDVARSLSVSLANVYVTRHRVAAALKKETARLERELTEKTSSRGAAKPAAGKSQRNQSR